MRRRYFCNKKNTKPADSSKYVDPNSTFTAVNNRNPYKITDLKLSARREINCESKRRRSTGHAAPTLPWKHQWDTHFQMCPTKSAWQLDWWEGLRRKENTQVKETRDAIKRLGMFVVFIVVFANLPTLWKSNAKLLEFIIFSGLQVSVTTDIYCPLKSVELIFKQNKENPKIQLP